MKASAVSTITKSLPIALSVLVNYSLLATLGYINLFSKKQKSNKYKDTFETLMINSVHRHPPAKQSRNERYRGENQRFQYVFSKQIAYGVQEKQGYKQPE